MPRTAGSAGFGVLILGVSVVCSDRARRPAQSGREGPGSGSSSGAANQNVAVNPLKKLMSWWRGPTDAETVASEAEAQRLQAGRQTIRISQNTVAKQTGSSLLAAPTPDLLDPEAEDNRNSR